MEPDPGRRSRDRATRQQRSEQGTGHAATAPHRPIVYPGQTMDLALLALQDAVTNMARESTTPWTRPRPSDTALFANVLRAVLLQQEQYRYYHHGQQHQLSEADAAWMLNLGTRIGDSQVYPMLTRLLVADEILGDSGGEEADAASFSGRDGSAAPAQTTERGVWGKAPSTPSRGPPSSLGAAGPTGAGMAAGASPSGSAGTTPAGGDSVSRSGSSGAPQGGTASFPYGSTMLAGLSQGAVSATKLEDLKRLLPDTPKRVCQYAFRQNEIVWICKVCQADETCVLCNECFRNSNHEGHEVFFYHAQAGGCCDCGDPDAWDASGFCRKHGLNHHDPLQELPPGVITAGAKIFPAVKQFLLRMVEDVAGSFDLDHPWRIDDGAVQGLSVVIHQNMIGEHAATDALAVVAGLTGTLIRRIRSQLREGSLDATTVKAGGAQDVQRLVEIARALSARGLLVSVCTDRVEARIARARTIVSWLHDVSTLSDGMCRLVCEMLDVPTLVKLMEADTQLPKALARAFHDMYLALMADQPFKTRIATAYVRAFPRVTAKYAEGAGTAENSPRSRGDESSASLHLAPFSGMRKLFYERLREGPFTFALYILSVQFLNRSAFVKELVEQQGLLQILGACLLLTLAPARRQDFDGGASGMLGKCTLNASHPVLKNRRYSPIITDLKCVLNIEGVPQRFLRRCFADWLEVLSAIQGINPQVRQVGAHVEHEVNDWMNAFDVNISLASLFEHMLGWLRQPVGAAEIPSGFSSVRTGANTDSMRKSGAPAPTNASGASTSATESESSGAELVPSLPTPAPPVPRPILWPLAAAAAKRVAETLAAPSVPPSATKMYSEKPAGDSGNAGAALPPMRLFYAMFEYLLWWHEGRRRGRGPRSIKTATNGVVGVVGIPGGASAGLRGERGCAAGSSSKINAAGARGGAASGLPAGAGSEPGVIGALRAPSQHAPSPAAGADSDGRAIGSTRTGVDLDLAQFAAAAAAAEAAITGGGGGDGASSIVGVGAGGAATTGAQPRADGYGGAADGSEGDPELVSLPMFPRGVLRARAYSSGKRSFHIILHRFFAGMVREACVCEERIGDLKQLAEEVGRYQEAATDIVNTVLDVLAFAGEIRSGLWRRNGQSMNDQVLNYSETNYCRVWRDLDVVLVQFSGLACGAHQLVNHVFHKFQCFHWLFGEYDESLQPLQRPAVLSAPGALGAGGATDVPAGAHVSPHYDFSDPTASHREAAGGASGGGGSRGPQAATPSRRRTHLDPDKQLALAEEALLLVILIVTEMPLPPDPPSKKKAVSDTTGIRTSTDAAAEGDVSNDGVAFVTGARPGGRLGKQLRRELVHRLAWSPCTHSDLQDACYATSPNETLETEVLEAILRDIATRRDPANAMEAAKWVLKPEVFASEYDATFYHQSTQAHQQAGERRPPINSPTPVAPPPPEAHPLFKPLREDVLASEALVRVVGQVLLRCVRDPSGRARDSLLPRALHLLTLAIHVFGDGNGNGSGGNAPKARALKSESPGAAAAAPASALHASYREKGGERGGDKDEGDGQVNRRREAFCAAAVAPLVTPATNGVVGVGIGSDGGGFDESAASSRPAVAAAPAPSQPAPSLSAPATGMGVDDAQAVKGAPLTPVQGASAAVSVLELLLEVKESRWARADKTISFGLQWLLDRLADMSDSCRRMIYPPPPPAPAPLKSTSTSSSACAPVPGRGADASVSDRGGPSSTAGPTMSAEDKGKAARQRQMEAMKLSAARFMERNKFLDMMTDDEEEEEDEDDREGDSDAAAGAGDASDRGSSGPSPSSPPAPAATHPGGDPQDRREGAGAQHGLDSSVTGAATAAGAGSVPGDGAAAAGAVEGPASTATLGAERDQKGKRVRKKTANSAGRKGKDVRSTPTSSPPPECIVCREESGGALGLVGFGTSSRVLDVREPSEDRSDGLHLQFCGHALHYKCFDQYYSTVVQASDSINNIALDVEAGEFQCPLCKSVGNLMVPATFETDCGRGAGGPMSSPLPPSRVQEGRTLDVTGGGARDGSVGNDPMDVSEDERDVDAAGKVSVVEKAARALDEASLRQGQWRHRRGACPKAAGKGLEAAVMVEGEDKQKRERKEKQAPTLEPAVKNFLESVHEVRTRKSAVGMHLRPEELFLGGCRALAYSIATASAALSSSPLDVVRLHGAAGDASGGGAAGNQKSPGVSPEDVSRLCYLRQVAMVLRRAAAGDDGHLGDSIRRKLSTALRGESPPSWDEVAATGRVASEVVSCRSPVAPVEPPAVAPPAGAGARTTATGPPAAVAAAAVAAAAAATAGTPAVDGSPVGPHLQRHQEWLQQQEQMRQQQRQQQGDLMGRHSGAGRSPGYRGRRGTHLKPVYGDIDDLDRPLLLMEAMDTLVTAMLLLPPEEVGAAVQCIGAMCVARVLQILSAHQEQEVRKRRQDEAPAPSSSIPSPPLWPRLLPRESPQEGKSTDDSLDNADARDVHGASNADEGQWVFLREASRGPTARSQGGWIPTPPRKGASGEKGDADGERDEGVSREDLEALVRDITAPESGARASTATRARGEGAASVASARVTPPGRSVTPPRKRGPADSHGNSAAVGGYTNERHVSNLRAPDLTDARRSHGDGSGSRSGGGGRSGPSAGERAPSTDPRPQLLEGGRREAELQIRNFSFDASTLLSSSDQPAVIAVGRALDARAGAGPGFPASAEATGDDIGDRYVRLAAVHATSFLRTAALAAYVCMADTVDGATAQDEPAACRSSGATSSGGAGAGAGDSGSGRRGASARAHTVPDDDGFGALCRFYGVPDSANALLAQPGLVYSARRLLTRSLDCCARWDPRWLELRRNLLAGRLFDPPLPVKVDLVRLPHAYTELHAEVSLRAADAGAHMAVCLVCSEVLSAQGSGACTKHARDCGRGIGIVFLLQECTVLLIHGERAAYFPSPYVDAYGERQRKSFRGRPLFLDERRYDVVRGLWIKHLVARTVVQTRSSSRQVIINNHY